MITREQVEAADIRAEFPPDDEDDDDGEFQGPLLVDERDDDDSYPHPDDEALAWGGIQ